MGTLSLEGQSLGKYQILQPLGAGGMARVYKAYHPQLDRYVAIKVLRPDLVGEEEFLDRFRREAQSVAALRHPNVVQVYTYTLSPLTSGGHGGLQGERHMAPTPTAGGSSGGPDISGWELKLVMEYCNEVGRGTGGRRL